MQIHFHKFDLPESFTPSGIVAIDTEAMGLSIHRDRLCLVQLSNGDGHCHLVNFPVRDFSKSPRLVALLNNPNITKLFHYARFDVAILQHSFNLRMQNIYCTKIASRLTRTFTNRHSLKELCKEFLNIELSKQEQTSDWGRPSLTNEQQKYAASDVLYLHKLKEKLDEMLVRENRTELAKACFDFLPYRVEMDLHTSESFDIFSYQT